MNALFKLTFSEPSPSLLLKLSIVKAVGENRLGLEWRKIARISIKGKAGGYIPDPTSDKQTLPEIRDKMAVARAH